MPVLRFAARRALGGRIAQQSLSGKRSAAGGSAVNSDAVESRPAGGNAGATSVPTAKPVPMSRPAAPKWRRCPHSISRSARCRRFPIGRDCQWTFPDAATSARPVAPPCSSAATAIAAIVTVRGRVPIGRAVAASVLPGAAIKPACAVVMRTPNASVATGPTHRK